MQLCINQVQKWVCENGFKLSVSKTTCPFSSSSSSSSFRSLLDGDINILDKGRGSLQIIKVSIQLCLDGGIIWPCLMPQMEVSWAGLEKVFICHCIFITLAHFWGASLEFSVHILLFSLLWLALSLNIMTCSALVSAWKAPCLLKFGCCSVHFFCWFAFIMTFASFKFTLVSICSWSDPSFSKLSATSFPTIPQCAGIHGMVTLWLSHREVRTTIISFRSCPDFSTWRTDLASLKKPVFFFMCDFPPEQEMCKSWWLLSLFWNL